MLFNICVHVLLHMQWFYSSHKLGYSKLKVDGLLEWLQGERRGEVTVKNPMVYQGHCNINDGTRKSSSVIVVARVARRWCIMAARGKETDKEFCRWRREKGSCWSGDILHVKQMEQRSGTKGG